MKGIQSLALFVIIILQPACVDPISFETTVEDSQLIFYGSFTQLDEDHNFSISRTSEFDKKAIPVLGAQITLYDDQGASASYQEEGEGNYRLPSDAITGVPGRAYHVEITLSNGENYRSIPQVMSEPVEIEDLYFNIDRREILSGSEILVDKTFVDIFVDTPLKDVCGEPSNLRWLVEEIYSFVDRSCGTFDTAETCYFIDPIDESEVLLFENAGGSQEFLEQQRVRSRELVPFDEFTARHYFIVYQYAISDQELLYWEKIDAVANQTGSLFDVQPATVLGNIFKTDDQREFTLGYFSVNGASKQRTFTTPFDIKPNPVFTCMDESFFRDNPSICCFCVNKPGIQIERPDFWDED